METLFHIGRFYQSIWANITLTILRSGVISFFGLKRRTQQLDKSLRHCIYVWSTGEERQSLCYIY